MMDRRGWIGASDAAVIMGDSPERILQLWREKRGEAEPPDLSDNLAVQMGRWLEPFILDWHARHCGVEITRRGEVVRDQSRGIPLQATLDGWDGARPVEAKALGAHTSRKSAWARYLPQIALQAILTGAPGAALSYLRGNEEWIVLEYERDPEYEAALLGALRRFWDCVQSGEPPVPLPAPPAPPPRGVVEYDMGASNAWAYHAGVWLETRGPAALHAVAAAELKALVPADASRAWGAGVEVRRDRRGALRIREMETEADTEENGNE